jgi:Na+/H+ antiporter NhaD/arsenite permease-like protein
MTVILVIVFVLGYAAIAFEHPLKIDKAAFALITGVVLWTIIITGSADKHTVLEELSHHLGDLSGILFFLLGAMTIVELIDAHGGFTIITSRINQTDKIKLLWTISLIAFFLSAVLDNLTTSIVMVSLLRKLIGNKNDRLFFAGMVIIAANAGGAWSPIGDVTTTMLWIGNQITPLNITTRLLLPSLVSLIVPLIFLSFSVKGKVEAPRKTVNDAEYSVKPLCRQIIFFSGIGVLLLVPVFKTVTHLPPYMGMLIGLGLLWILTEILHKDKEEEHKHAFTVAHAVRRTDTPSILFFLGILISISALEYGGILTSLANWLTQSISSLSAIVLSIGLLSAIVDNVPLVAATMGMYDLTQFPTDHFFWEFLAYCAGTGGSILIIGSAAGVATMGMEKINFIWYLKKISLLALLGYFAGAGVYLLEEYLFHM